MAEQTNNYAHRKILQIMEGQDNFQQMDHHRHHQHARQPIHIDFQCKFTDGLGL